MLKALVLAAAVVLGMGSIARAQQNGPRDAGLYLEKYRPQFHFTAQKNWLNDPNGLVYYQGEYHLFFQHNPAGIEWGNMTWGHAISKDLVHWQQVEHALLPDKLGTMFSGSAVVDWNNTAGFQKGTEKTLVAIYTAAGGTSEESKGQPFTQCIAYSNDRGRTWTKYEQNPVLKHIVGGNRDPKVIWHEPSQKWIMALYLDGNEFAFFSSPNLKQWTLLHKMNVPGCDECPDFFPMAVDGKADNIRWVWTAANGRYLVGSFDGTKFTPDGGVQQVDFGKNFYAVQSYSDIPESDGRRIQIAWMRGGKYPGMPFNQQMGFPCELKLQTFPEGIRMTRWPVKEIETLRGQEHTWNRETLKPGENPLAGIRGELFDIQAEVELGEASEFGFKVRGEKVAYLVKEKKLSALGASGPLELKDGRLTMRLLVDRASVEAFGDEGKLSLSSCFVPQAEGLEAYCTGGNVRIASLKVYELKSAWK